MSLVLMKIKVDTVISDIFDKSGNVIIEAIFAGNHDPKSLVLLVDPRCKASRETIENSLEKTGDSVHLFELRQSYDLYRYIHTQIANCEAEMYRLIQTAVALICGAMSLPRSGWSRRMTYPLTRRSMPVCFTYRGMPSISINSMGLRTS